MVALMKKISKPEFKKSKHFIFKMLINWLGAMIVGWAVARWYCVAFSGTWPKAGTALTALLDVIQTLGGGGLIIGILTLLHEIYRKR